MSGERLPLLQQAELEQKKEEALKRAQEIEVMRLKQQREVELARLDYVDVNNKRVVAEKRLFELIKESSLIQYDPANVAVITPFAKERLNSSLQLRTERFVLIEKIYRQLDKEYFQSLSKLDDSGSTKEEFILQRDKLLDLYVDAAISLHSAPVSSLRKMNY